MISGPPNPKTDFVGGKNPRSHRVAGVRGGVWGKLKLAGIALAVGGLAIACALLFSTDKRTTRQVAGAVSAEQLEELRRRSVELEATFERLRQQQFELKEEDLQLLQRALTAQEDYISARQSVGTDDARLTRLRRTLHLLRSERLRRESDEAEAKALTLAKTDAATAIGLLRRAGECEKEIASKWGAAGLADPGRIARLDTRLRRLESESLWSKGRELETEGEKSLQAEKFEQAAQQFGEAIEKENEFLSRYRDVRDTEFARVDKLSGRRETALSGLVWRQVLAQRAAAESAEKSVNWDKAAGDWQKAMDIFGRLLTDFPRSQFADRALEVKMGIRLNFARLHKEITEVRAGAEKMRALLRGQDAVAGTHLAADLLVRARRLSEANTGAFDSGSPEREELEFISSHEAATLALLPNIQTQLLPVPGLKVRMYRTEITQGLYTSLMGANPSSVRREANPVESVSYPEAEEFCRRMGWLSGFIVRLPTVAEFTAAAGDVTKAPQHVQAWVADNTDGVSARAVGSTMPNAHGFNDLLGNVEEWVQAPASDAQAPVLGGSIATLAAPGLPNRTVLKREKSRTLGFRIIVE
jgi:formylglycine-generating enzyme required for sulfatase activity